MNTRTTVFGKHGVLSPAAYAQMLRRRLVIVTTLFIGSLVFLALAANCYFFYIQQRHVAEDSLENITNYALSNDALDTNVAEDGSSEITESQILARGMAIIVAPDGMRRVLSIAPLDLEDSRIEHILDIALQEHVVMDYIPDQGVFWKRTELYDGRVVVAIVNGAIMMSIVRKHATFCLVVFLVSLIPIVLISVLLVRWAIKPIDAAWAGEQRFIANASHELKTPLAVILSASKLLVSSKEISASDVKWASSIYEEGLNLKSLIEDMLFLAKSDELERRSSHPSLPSLKEVDLSSLVDACSLEFDAPAFERGCTIETDLEPNIMLECDEEGITRLIRILLDNACKYADEGTIITVSLCSHLGKAKLDVNNLGTVISSEELPRLFERFFRSDKSRSRSTGGYGLGLPIAKAIVDSHNGSISVSSTAEEGTTFTVLL